MAEYVLDSFAILALLDDDAGAEALAGKLEDEANRFRMSVVNLGEIYYVMLRRHGVPEAEAAIADIRGQENIRVEDADWERVRLAAKFKAEGGISYADAFACGLAKEYDAILLSGDPELQHLRSIRVQWPAE